jgi:chromosome segregation and condensation protein ScpB
VPPELRWREWMGRVEAVIFASPAPATREVLGRVVGKGCNLDLLIEDIREELRGRPYELVAVAGGWRHQTRKGFAEAIHAATGLADRVKELSRAEAGVLMAIAYFQPVTRGEISEMFGREVSRDLIASLRAAGVIAAGLRSPQPGAPYPYVTTPGFCRNSGSRACAICLTWRSSRTPACSAGLDPMVQTQAGRETSTACNSFPV